MPGTEEMEAMGDQEAQDEEEIKVIDAEGSDTDDAGAGAEEHEDDVTEAEDTDLVSKVQEHETKYLRCVLTEEELKEISKEMAEEQQKKQMAEERKKGIMADLKGDIESAELQVAKCARMIRDGYIMRDIKCLVERDYDLKTVTYIRLDTGETHKTRAMRGDEMQVGLPFVR